MSVNPKKTSYSVEEYLELEDRAEYRSEFYKGEIYAMSGGTRNHSLIAANISAELRNTLFDSDCFVFSSDLKVWVESANTFYYPDCQVICGPEQYYQDRQDIITNPTVVIEVLSESTGAWDRGGKFRQYEQIPALQEYVLIEQEEAQVDVLRRNADGHWVRKGYSGLDVGVQFESLKVSVSMKGIYHGVKFPEPKERPARS